MITAPTSATMLAIRADRLGLSLRNSQPMAAAQNGAVAKMTATWVTEVSRSAMMVVRPATLPQTAKAQPGRPSLPNPESAESPSHSTSSKSRLSIPKTPRQARSVGVSTETLRVKNPNVLQATVAPATQSTPKRCREAGRKRGTVGIATLFGPRKASVVAVEAGYREAA